MSTEQSKEKINNEDNGTYQQTRSIIPINIFPIFQV